MEQPNRFQRMADRLRSHLGVSATAAGVFSAAGATLMLLGIEERADRTPKPALTSNIWFNVGVVLLVIAVVVVVGVLTAVLLPSREERADHMLKGTAGDLAGKIDRWLHEQLADDPLPPGQPRPLTPEESEVHNRLWMKVELEFGPLFGEELRNFTTELRREQIGSRFEVSPPSVGTIRQLVRELRAFSELRGHLKRG